jgi:fido (protein-threonine AMPylation protein)
LRQNLAGVLSEIVRTSQQRTLPTLEAARRWHVLIMQGLDVPDARWVGAFRGAPGLETLQVRVGANYGTDSSKVAAELASFEAKVQALVRQLDLLVPAGREPDADQLAAIIDLCAWVHAEWVRIHPFANGNGRTARLWANSLALRYGLPPFIRLRPKPNSPYGNAAAKAMRGDWKPIARVFHQQLSQFLDEL